MLDDKLTLDKCILQVRQEEEVKRQQEIINGPQAALNSIENKSRYKQKSTSHKQPTSQTSQSTQSMSSQFSRKQLKVQQQQFSSSDRCKWCGRDRHDRNSCPAHAKFRACGTMDHFACVCRKNNSVSQRCKTAHHMSTLSKNSAATSLYLFAL